MLAEMRLEDCRLYQLVILHVIKVSKETKRGRHRWDAKVLLTQVAQTSSVQARVLLDADLEVCA